MSRLFPKHGCGLANDLVPPFLGPWYLLRTLFLAVDVVLFANVCDIVWLSAALRRAAVHGGFGRDARKQESLNAHSLTVLLSSRELTSVRDCTPTIDNREREKLRDQWLSISTFTDTASLITPPPLFPSYPWAGRMETYLRVHLRTPSGRSAPGQGHSHSRDGGRPDLVRPRTYPGKSRPCSVQPSLESSPCESGDLVGSIVRRSVRDEPKDGADCGWRATTRGPKVGDSAVVMGHLDGRRWCGREDRSDDYLGEAAQRLFGTRLEGDAYSEGSNGGLRCDGKAYGLEEDPRSRGQRCFSSDSAVVSGGTRESCTNQEGSFTTTPDWTDDTKGGRLWSDERSRSGYQFRRGDNRKFRPDRSASPPRLALMSNKGNMLAPNHDGDLSTSWAKRPDGLAVQAAGRRRRSIFRRRRVVRYGDGDSGGDGDGGNERASSSPRRPTVSRSTSCGKAGKRPRWDSRFWLLSVR